MGSACLRVRRSRSAVGRSKILASVSVTYEHGRCSRSHGSLSGLRALEPAQSSSLWRCAFVGDADRRNVGRAGWGDNVNRKLIERRTILGGSLAAAALAAACSGRRGPDVQVSPPGAVARQPATVQELIEATPFYIAHRGGGANWPEMTAFAYEQATALPGLRAIEISVCLSKDNVLVCSHDPTTERVTGIDYIIREQPWSVLQPLVVTSAFTMDPSQPARPFTRFEDVIERYASDFVVFVEPKTPEAVEPLMATMVAIEEPTRTVWKQPINHPNFARAKAHGFTTWGYVLNEPGHLGQNLLRFAAAEYIDALGAERRQPDANISQVVAAARRNGKKTIMWNIETDEDRLRALRLGCEGMMTSNIAQVPYDPLPTPQVSSRR